MTGDVINVSGWRDEDKEGGYYRSYFPQARSYQVSNGPGEHGLADRGAVTDVAIDLSVPVGEEFHQRFDLVFNHTVLEHVFEVTIAFNNLCAMSRDAVLLVVPFAQQMHFTASYGDYWRFTPQALRKLFRLNGFTVIYEAANDHRNASIYVVMVASRHPARWSDRVPAWSPIEHIAERLATSVLREQAATLRRRARRIARGRAVPPAPSAVEPGGQSGPDRVGWRPGA